MTTSQEAKSCKTLREPFPVAFMTSFDCGRSTYCRLVVITSMIFDPIEIDRPTGLEIQNVGVLFLLRMGSRLTKRNVARLRDGRFTPRGGRPLHAHVVDPRVCDLRALSSLEDKLPKGFLRLHGPFARIHIAATRAGYVAGIACSFH